LGETGGAAVSGSPFAGHADRLSRYSYLVSLFPARIASDLGLRVELRTRAVSAYAPVAGGRGLIVDAPADSERTRASFPCPRDHDAWLTFYALADAFARRVFPTLVAPLPARDDVRALVADLPGAWELFAERPLGESLRERFDDGLVRGVVATDGLIGTFADLDEPTLRQNACFLWHLIGGPWRVPVGGMGALTRALARVATAAGAELRCGAEVVGVDHGPGERSSVAWVEAGGERGATARFVLDARPPSGAVPEGAQLKLNMLLDRLPRLRSGIAAEDAFAGTFRLNEHEADLAAAFAQATTGAAPERPPAELYCHSLTDRSILAPDAPPGRHTLTLFGLHTPAALFRADNEGMRRLLTERYLDALDEHLDDPIRDCLARDADGRPCVEAKSPVDLERDLGLPGGNIFHGDLTFPWTGPGGAPDGARWGCETGHPRVFTAGASAARGGGVSGIAGHNAAMAVLERRAAAKRAPNNA
ncbi:MAG: hypothetical protein QOJ07_2720, partial [Thermoleophilaceae bacterium]|nr:hypothetical protein [Thermoleophilaceae bacterium]